MQLVASDQGTQLVESTIAWWREAGVDYLCLDDPVNWLAEPAVQKTSVIKANISVQAASGTTLFQPVRSEWPSDFDALIEAISADATMPGNGYSRHIAAPVGIVNPELMVLCDFPEEAELAAASLGNGATGELLTAMIRACGYDLANVYIAALAHSRPASGALPAQDIAALAGFAKHHISVARPEKLLFLGSAVSEALLAKDLMTARAGLPDFNHDGRNVAAVATFHPRTLLARPILKAQTWQDLQRILRKNRL
ncbi:MAG: uracil-DNA glycosylase family protein [Sphingorhabdus sp.]